jgi:four helix bundle protein
MAKKIEDLPIHSKVEEFWIAVNAILDLPEVRRDSDLHDEISRANESVPSNMVEGFEQGTDRAFAHFLTYSKGSIAEVLTRLRKAYYRRYISQEVLDARLAQGEELSKMLGGFIKYLQTCDWKDRGYHNAATENEAPSPKRGRSRPRKSPDPDPCKPK